MTPSSSSADQALKRVERSPTFQAAVIFIIVLSAIAIGAKTYDLSPLAGSILSVLDVAITVFFLVELLLRFSACDDRKSVHSDNSAWFAALARKALRKRWQSLAVSLRLLLGDGTVSWVFAAGRLHPGAGTLGTLAGYLMGGRRTALHGELLRCRAGFVDRESRDRVIAESRPPTLMRPRSTVTASISAASCIVAGGHFTVPIAEGG